MIKKKLLLIALLLWQVNAWAQITVSGTVKENGSGETLPFANIIIKSINKGTSTNVDGFFSLPDVPSDTSTLVISYVGYMPKELKLNSELIKGRLEILLEPISTSLEEVVISANSNKFLNSSKRISQATISTKQLSLLPSIGEVDIFRSLQLLPGVSGTNENSSGLFVRGGTPDQNLVLLDGMTVYKVDHFFGFFSAFNANAIKDVQLYKGGFPAKYGGRTSSVVDLTGKTGSFEEIKGGAGINLLSANAYLEIPLFNKASFLIAGRRSYTDIIKSGVFNSITDNLLQDDDNATLNRNLQNTEINEVEPDFFFFDWNSKLSYRPSEKDLISISLYNGKDFLDESRDFNRSIERRNIPNRLIIGDITDKTDWGNRGISGKWSRQWSPKFYSNFLVAGSEYFSQYDRNAFLEASIPSEDSILFSGNFSSFEDNNVQDISIRLDNEWQLSSKHKLEFGALFTRSNINYSNIRNDTITILERKQEADYSSFYLSSTRNPTDRLTLSTGMRISYYQPTDQFLYSPRFSFSYDITNKIKIKGAYGKYYQFVNRIINENVSEGSRDFWLLADGELVDVSSSKHYILGASYENSGWLFDIEGYYKDLSGLSEFSLRFRRAQDFNPDELFFIGDGVAKGIEFLLQKKQGQYTGWISYTLGSVRHNFEVFNDGQDFPALHDQLHEFKMVHSYAINDRWNFSSTFVYGSGKPFSEPDGLYSLTLLDGRELDYIGIGSKNGSRLPAYHRLDFSIHHKFPIGKAKADIGLSIFNFYNRKNTWYIEYDFTQDPVLITEINYLGFTPNLSFNIDF
ncbi:TonB-dependent receptor [Fulvivirgaceae bacterium BMA10]|uniref:TonB-dependent receptor n=1 Tax=Splendidivirga corallicola TaxID=3051826 RepID=A0ABT8KXT8_9BACT|nr:TonB-dependent receptor [Fulvivirgaceae bacterium BMA10]